MSLSQCLCSGQTCESGGAHSGKWLQLPRARDLLSKSDWQFVSEGPWLQWESITFLFVELPDLHVNSRSMQAHDPACLPDHSKSLEKVLNDPLLAATPGQLSLRCTHCTSGCDAFPALHEAHRCFFCARRCV